MHNSHFCVVSAASPEDACDAVRSELSDWGDASNWSMVLGCVWVDKDGKDRKYVYSQDDRLSSIKSEHITVATINEEIRSYALDRIRPERVADLKWATKQVAGGKDPKTLRGDDYIRLLNAYDAMTAYADLRHAGSPSADGFDCTVNGADYRGGRYDEYGVTHIETDDEDQDNLQTYVVVIDMHS